MVLTCRIEGEAPLLSFARCSDLLEDGVATCSVRISVGEIAVAIHDVVDVTCVGDGSYRCLARYRYKVEDELVRLDAVAAALHDT